MRLFAAVLLFGTTLIGADLSGIWVGQIPTRNGESVDVAFQFVQQGETLKGKLYGDYGSTPIAEGAVTGDSVVFTVVAQEQAGNQINQNTLRFTGTLKGDQLELIRERRTSRDAGNGGNIPLKGDNKQTFQVKRLL